VKITVSLLLDSDTGFWNRSTLSMGHASLTISLASNVASLSRLHLIPSKQYRIVLNLGSKYF